MAVESTILPAAHAVLGPLGSLLAGIFGATIALVLVIVALGLSGAEWRTAGHGAAGAARISVRRSRGVAGFLHRNAGRAAALFWRGSPPAAEAEQAARQPPVFVPAASPSGAAARLKAALRRGREPEEAPVAEPAGGAVVVTPGRRPAKVATPVARPAPRQESLPLGEAGWNFPSLSLLAPAPRADRHRPLRGIAPGQCAAARIRAGRLRRAGHHQGDPPWPGGHAV